MVNAQISASAPLLFSACVCISVSLLGGTLVIRLNVSCNLIRVILTWLNLQRPNLWRKVIFIGPWVSAESLELEYRCTLEGLNWQQKEKEVGPGIQNVTLSCRNHLMVPCLSTTLAFSVDHVATKTGAEVRVRGSNQTEGAWARWQTFALLERDNRGMPVSPLSRWQTGLRWVSPVNS